MNIFQFPFKQFLYPSGWFPKESIGIVRMVKSGNVYLFVSEDSHTSYFLDRIGKVWNKDEVRVKHPTVGYGVWDEATTIFVVTITVQTSCTRLVSTESGDGFVLI